MFKKLLTFMAVIAIVFAVTVPAKAEVQNMWAYVYTWDGKMNADGTPVLTRQTENITFLVLERNYVDTVETLYYYDTPAMTSLTNPVTGTNFTAATVCNDMIRFAVDPTETGDRYVDLLVVDQDGGFSTYVEDFDKYTHTIIIDERKHVKHHGMIWYASTTSAEIDTGIDFNDNVLIHSVAVEVVTLDADETIIVGILSTGTGGDADGFVQAFGIGTVGYYDVRRHSDVQMGRSSGVSRMYYMESTTPLGVLLGTIIPGSGGDTLANAGSEWAWDHRVYAGQEASLTYTPSTCSTAWGFIHYYFTQIR